MIQDIIGGDLFHIETVQSYPQDYHETIEVAKKELNNNARPTLSNKMSNMGPVRSCFFGGILTGGELYRWQYALFLNLMILQ